MPGDYWQYCFEMERDSTWGDHVTLQAASDAYGVAIIVMTSYGECCFIRITPREPRSSRCLYLSFWAEVRGGLLHKAIGAPITRPAKRSGEPIREKRLAGRFVQHCWHRLYSTRTACMQCLAV